MNPCITNLLGTSRVLPSHDLCSTSYRIKDTVSNIRCHSSRKKTGMPSRRLGFAMISNRPETIVEDTDIESLLVEEAPSTSDAHWLLSSMVSREKLLTISMTAIQLVAGIAVGGLLHPSSAMASEALPSSWVLAFLERIDSLGPLGPVIFVITVASLEMIPLFPTQPFSLASGLLFGPQKGAAVVLAAVVLASLGAFSVSRGFGRDMVNGIIRGEVEGESDATRRALQDRIRGIETAVEKGTFLQQVTAVAVLRLTPIIPFSASSYLLGLTPLPLPSYFVGSVLGMSVWSVIYASLGGASRSVLASGVEVDVLMTDLAAKAGKYSETAAVVGLGLGVLAALVWAVGMIKNRAMEGETVHAAVGGDENKLNKSKKF